MSKKVTMAVLVCGVMLSGLVVVFGKLGFGQKKVVQKNIRVVTTLYPLYHFAKEIGGDLVEITLLIPPGVEPHSFEPNPRDMITLNQANLFIYTGPLMETWVANMLKGVNNRQLVIVNASEGIHLIPAVFIEEGEKKGGLDPHIWLGLNNVEKIIDEIARGLIQIDTNNGHIYTKNAQNYLQKIKALEDEYITGLAQCKERTIVYGGHYTFGYLAKEYNLYYLATQGISSDAEPTAQDISRLVELVKQKHIPSIFYQELSSPKVAETISQETGARMLLLNGAHTVSKKDFQKGISFIEIMRDNLAHLRKGLECK